jgi:hypothetical protein
LYVAFGGFLAIALIWAFILFGIMRFGFKVKFKFVVLILFFFAAISLVILIAGAAFEYIEQPEFCGTTCHPRANVIVDDAPMDPFYQGYVSPGNNTMMAVHNENEVYCSGCHDKPGLLGKAEAYYKAVFEVVNYVTGNYESDDLGGHVGSENCLKCHDGHEAPEPGLIVSFYNITFYPHEDDIRCAECHVAHQVGIGLSTQACTSCHSIDMATLEQHGITAGENCMSCHDRKHPEDALISFRESPKMMTNDLCGSCHQAQFSKYNTWTDPEKNLYGNCIDSCHAEHRESSVPHIITAPYRNNCSGCHVDGVGSHDLSNLGFDNFTYDISSDFCGECHEEEYILYEEWPEVQKSFYGVCTTRCHVTHKEVITPHDTDPPLEENCGKCHEGGVEYHKITSVSFKDFNKTLRNDFCSSCHPTTYDSFDNGIHNSFKCLQCHLEHKTVQVVFDQCAYCHSSILDSHDEGTKGCNLCHNMEVIHSVG